MEPRPSCPCSNRFIDRPVSPGPALFETWYHCSPGWLRTCNRVRGNLSASICQVLRSKAQATVHIKNPKLKTNLLLDWESFLEVGSGVISKLLFLQYFLELILLCSTFYVSSKCVNKNTFIHFFNYNIIQKLGKYLHALYGRWKLGLFN